MLRNDGHNMPKIALTSAYKSGMQGTKSLAGSARVSLASFLRAGP